MIPDLLNIVTDHTGVRWRVTHLDLQTLYHDMRAEFSHLVEEIANPGSIPRLARLCGGQHCDLLAGDFTISADRRVQFGAQFSTPFHMDGLQLLMRYKNDWLDTAAFALQPFSPSLWAAWLMSLFLAAGVSLVLQSPRTRRALYPRCLRGRLVAAGAEEDFGQLSPGDALYGAALNTFNSSDTGVHTTLGGRVFVVMYSMLLLVIVSSYTASVAHRLGQKHIELLMAKVPYGDASASPHRFLAAGLAASDKGALGILRGGSTEHFLVSRLGIDTHAFTDLDRYIGPDGFDEKDEVLALGHLTAISMHQVDLEHFLAQHELRARAAGRDPCHNKWTMVPLTRCLRASVRARTRAYMHTCIHTFLCIKVGSTFAERSSGWLFAPSLPAEVRESINTIFDRMREDRSLDGLLSTWFRRSSTPCLAPGPADRMQLSIADFLMLFVLLALLALALVLLIVLQDLGLMPHSLARMLDRWSLWLKGGGRGRGGDELEDMYAASQYDMIRRLLHHQQAMLKALEMHAQAGKGDGVQEGADDVAIGALPVVSDDARGELLAPIPGQTRSQS